MTAVTDLAELLVVGEAGVGKTALVNTLVPALERDGFVCLRATGTAAMTSHPLAAIGHLVGDPGVAIGPALTAWAVESVRASPPARPRSSSSTMPISWTPGRCTRWLRLGPGRAPTRLPGAHGRAVARGDRRRRTVFGRPTGSAAPVAARDVESRRVGARRCARHAEHDPVQATTDGLPLAVGEMLRHARRRDALVLRSGLYRWDPGANVDQHLATLLGLRVNDLDERQRTVVDTLVVVDDLPIEIVRALAPGVDMVDLEDQRLVTASVRPGWVRSLIPCWGMPPPRCSVRCEDGNWSAHCSPCWRTSSDRRRSATRASTRRVVGRGRCSDRARCAAGGGRVGPRPRSVAAADRRDGTGVERRPVTGDRAHVRRGALLVAKDDRGGGRVRRSVRTVRMRRGTGSARHRTGRAPWRSASAATMPGLRCALRPSQRCPIPSCGSTSPPGRRSGCCSTARSPRSSRSSRPVRHRPIPVRWAAARFRLTQTTVATLGSRPDGGRRRRICAPSRAGDAALGRSSVGALGGRTVVGLVERARRKHRGRASDAR